jgi:hypothetical protein
MMRSFAVALVCFLSVAVLGQTSTTTSTLTTTTSTMDLTALDLHTPTENLSPASVAARGPASWVAAARQRHQAFIQARVTNPRNGEAAGTADGLEPVSDTVSGGTGSLGGLGDLGSLLDLVGGTSGLSGVVSGLTGTTGTGSGTGTTGGMTLADLLALRDQLLGSSSASGTTSDTSGKSAAGNGKTASRSMELRGGSGAIGRLPKIDAQSATSDGTDTGTSGTGTGTTTTPKFLNRLANGLANSFFTALTAGFQSDAFVSYIEAWMRPMFFPQDYTSSSSSDSGSGSSSSDNGSGSGSSDNGSDNSSDSSSGSII